MKKVRSLKDILNDPRIERVVKNYDGYAKHMIECKDGYRFEGDRTIDIGNIYELCASVNENLEEDKPRDKNNCKHPIEHMGADNISEYCTLCYTFFEKDTPGSWSKGSTRIK
jgi:hypothetical protein